MIQPAQICAHLKVKDGRILRYPWIFSFGINERKLARLTLAESEIALGYLGEGSFALSYLISVILRRLI
jgi:hypothetical protein